MSNSRSHFSMQKSSLSLRQVHMDSGLQRYKVGRHCKRTQWMNNHDRPIYLEIGSTLAQGSTPNRHLVWCQQSLNQDSFGSLSLQSFNSISWVKWSSFPSISVRNELSPCRILKWRKTFITLQHLITYKYKVGHMKDPQSHRDR